MTGRNSPRDGTELLLRLDGTSEVMGQKMKKEDVSFFIQFHINYGCSLSTVMTLWMSCRIIFPKIATINQACEWQLLKIEEIIWKTIDGSHKALPLSRSGAQGSAQGLLVALMSL